MPEAAAVGSIWQIRLIGEIEGQETNNVFHFACVGASADVDLHLIQVFIQCFVTNILPVLTSGWTFREVRWKQVGPTLGNEFVSLPSGQTAGGGNAAHLPSYSSALFSIRGLLGGRSHRGRFFLPGIPEDQTTNSFLNQSTPMWAALIAFAVCLLTNFKNPDPAGGSDLFDIGVYSRKLGGSAFPYSMAGFTAANQIAPVALLATTRSRKVGRGS